MDRKNEVVDISSFLLVEGSADSEADCEFLKLCQDVIMVCEYVDGDDDDAESCSCDSSNTLGFLQVFDCEDDDEEDDAKDFEDDKDIQYHNQNWPEYMCCNNGEAESKDGSRKMLDQMDDRLFWETCMAVGYP